MDSMEVSHLWTEQDQLLLPSLIDFKHNEGNDKLDLLSANEFAHFSEENIDDIDLLPDWMELKFDDLAQLGELDNFADLLDDPDKVMLTEDFEEKSTNFLPPNISSDLAASSVIASPPYSNSSPPYSPEGYVPSVSAPNSPTSLSGFEVLPLIEAEPMVISLPEDANIDNCLFFMNQALSQETEGSQFTIMLTEQEPEPEYEVKHEEEANSLVPIAAKRGRKRKGSELTIPKEPKTRKERKRVQNKDAATRYRQKKRAESEAVFGEEDILLNENKQLNEKANQLSTEISYLKGLMREMFKARGILK